MTNRSSSRVAPSKEMPISLRTALPAPSAATTYEARTRSDPPARTIVAVTPSPSICSPVSDDPYSTCTPNADNARRRISSVRHCGISHVSGYGTAGLGDGSAMPRRS
jgi:hypothetical protein